MDAETRRLVRARANERCEYCGIHQRIYPDFAFHIEHIVARQHGGSNAPDNLALSCHLATARRDPISRASILRRGFSPGSSTLAPTRGPSIYGRRTTDDGRIVGRTDVGRATVQLLDMNSEMRIRIRREIARIREP